ASVCELLEDWGSGLQEPAQSALSILSKSDSAGRACMGCKLASLDVPEPRCPANDPTQLARGLACAWRQVELALARCCQAAGCGVKGLSSGAGKQPRLNAN